MGRVAARLAALPVTQREKLESLLLDFDVAWSPEALASRADELPSDDQDYRQVALWELVRVDLERQWQAGSKPQAEDYLARFPELGTKATIAPELLLAEYQARQLSGQSVELNEFARRFPQQVEPLKQLLEKSHQSASHQPSRAAHTDTSREGERVATQADSAGQAWSLPKELGRYRILKLLGEGGMGSVYLAHDTELDRQVAIKTPNFAGDEDPRLIERFYREARAAAKLQNRHICQVYDVGEIDGVRYISMAYIEGRPLSAYVRTAHNQPERSVVLVVRRLAQALQEAHSQGVVHRDLKPANIMIDSKKEPVIMDFGLARQLDKHDDSRLTRQGAIMGSPAYMSPEQVAGKIDRVGPASDIYSLGVVLYELVTGRVPFEGPTIAVLGQIMTQDAPQPSEFRKDMDPRLEQICLKMMAKRIEDRCASMHEVTEALGQWLMQPADGEAEGDAVASGMSPAEGEDQQSEDMFATRYARDSSNSVDGPTGNASSSPVRGLISGTRSKTVASVAAGLVGLSLLGLLGLLITLRTPHGLLTIEIEDPNLKILIDGNEYTFEQLTEPQNLDAGSHRLAAQVGETVVPIGRKMTLKTAKYDGEYKLAVRLDGASITSESFTIVRGDERVLSIALESAPNPPAVARRVDQSRQPPAVRTTEPAATVPPTAIAPFDEAQAKQHQEAWAAHLGIPVERTNSIGMKLVLIPPGEFEMGSTQEEVNRLLAKSKQTGNPAPGYIDFLPSEVPQHRARLTRAFWLGVCEVTVGQFRRFVDDTGYLTQGEKDGMGGHGRDASGTWGKSPEFTWRQPGYAQSDDHAVVLVTWNDAVAFCEWLSRKEGTTSRLPTEAEWEYACRSGTTTKYYFGDDMSELGDYAWFDGSHMTHPVGLKKPNAWGLYDMHGNVSEWCGDWFDEEYYANSPVDDPAGGAHDRQRVKRGGDWCSHPETSCHAACRSGNTPGSRVSLNGFRVATVMVDGMTNVKVEPPRHRDASTWTTILPADAPSAAVPPFDAGTAIQHQEAWADYSGASVEQDVDLGDDVTLKLVLIPPGEFMMGSTQEEIDIWLMKEKINGSLDDDLAKCIRSERPQHKVRITQPFYLAAHEITVGQFKAFVRATEYRTEGELDSKGSWGRSVVDGKWKWKLSPEYNWRNPGFQQAEEHPVVFVSWNDTMAFCHWLSEKEGRAYSLPTEAQWEYACRAGSMTRWYFGNDRAKLKQYAWYSRRPSITRRTEAVGLKLPNGFGLFDMHGSVREWCSDWYSETYYGLSPLDDPDGPPSGRRRVYRDGPSDNRWWRIRSALRHNKEPSSRTASRGFRVARTCP